MKYYIIYNYIYFSPPHPLPFLPSPPQLVEFHLLKNSWTQQDKVY